MKAIKFLLIFISFSAIAQKKTKGKTFKVDNVEVAPSLLNDTSYKLVLEKTLDKKVYAYPEKMKDDNLVPVHMNGFINTLHRAYAEHRPLELSPDAIWLLICQGFAIHLNENYDSLKHKVFKNDVPHRIYVRNDALVDGKGEDWSDLINQFTLSADSLIYGDLAHLVVPEFSTTTPIIKTSYQATMLNAVEDNFQFMGASGCGIPSITLLGTEKDWIQIHKNVDQFRQYGLGEWVDALKPVLNEFLQAYRGKEDKEFWKKIYKEVTMYGRYNISGWIIKFYPYFKGVEWPDDDEELEPEEYQPTQIFYKNEYLKDYDYQLCPLSSNSLPEAYAMVKLKWRVFNTSTTFVDKDMELYAGFIGIRQNNKTKAIRPEISWAVCYKDAETPEYFSTYRNASRDTEHNNQEFWEPRIIKNPETHAIYHHSVNQTYEEGIEEITRTLSSGDIRLTGDTEISFIVTWSGYMTKLEIESGSLSEIEVEKLSRMIKNLPHKWKPASRMLRNHEARGKMVPFNSNYKVSITI